MAKGYSLSNPRLDTEIDGEGSGFVTVWNVPYLITEGAAQGTRGHVRIPASQYNAETVHAAVQQAVDSHNDVMSR